MSSYNLRDIASLLTIGPLVLFSLTFMVVCFYILKYSTARTLLGYSALVGVSAALINSAITLANAVNTINNYGEYASVSPSYFVFEAIYDTFSFVPGLIAFRRISRHRSNTFGTCNVYFGFLWSAVVLILGLVLTIMSAVVKRDYYTDGTFSHTRRILIFLHYCNWGFIAILWALHGIYFQDLKGKARNSFLAYTTLNLFSAAVYAIMSSISYLDVDEDIEKMFLITFIVSLILCSIPVAIAFILVVHFGHLWNVNSNDAKLNSVVNSEDSRIAEEPTKRLNL